MFKIKNTRVIILVTFYFYHRTSCLKEMKRRTMKKMEMKRKKKTRKTMMRLMMRWRDMVVVDQLRDHEVTL